jgi:hypothetical protein
VNFLKRDVMNNLKASKIQGIPKTTAEMMQQATFEGWDFDNIWTIDEGRSYPSLRWQE